MVLLDFSMFPVDKGESLSEEVAEIMKPRKRKKGRLLSPAERDRLIKAGEKYRFRTGLESPKTALESPPTAQAIDNTLPALKTAQKSNEPRRPDAGGC